MREIKFRGKSIYSINEYGISKGQWVYGFYFQEAEDTNDGFSFEYNSYIRMSYGDYFVDIQIDEKSVGQYTGLKDANDVEIYEGDIIKYNRGNNIELLVVEWCKNYATFVFGHIKVEFALRYGEVIGNIYENPELLEDK